MNTIIRCAKVIALFLFLAAAFELTLGGVFYWRTASFIKSAQKASGKIVELERQESGEGGGAVYHPVYSFVDSSGVEQRVTSSVGSYPPAFEVGETITVQYSPGNPKDAQIDSFWSLWLLPIILGGMALVEIVFGLIAIYLVPMIGRFISGKQNGGQQVQKV